MIKTNTSRWYDVQCDAPDCEMLASAEYQQCIGWALTTQAVNAAVEAGWERREEDGLEHMYCPWHKREEYVTYSTYLAKCSVCGSTAYSATTGTIDNAYANFIRLGWKVERTKTVCPECAKKVKRND